MPYQIELNTRVQGVDDLQKVDQAMSSIERSAKTTEQELAGLDRHFKQISDSGRAFQNALDNIAKTAVRTAEVAGSLAIAAKAVQFAFGGSTAAITKQASAIDSVVNSFRSLRFAFSPTALTGFTVVAGIATEAVLKLAHARKQLYEAEAISAARQGISFTDAATVGSISRITGQDMAPFSGMTAAQIRKYAVEFGGIADPAARGQRAFEVFGENAPAALALLKRDLRSTTESAYELAGALDSKTRLALGRLTNDLAEPTRGFRALRDEWAALAEQAKHEITVRVAVLYSRAMDAAGSVHQGGPTVFRTPEEAMADAFPGAPRRPSDMEFASGFSELVTGGALAGRPLYAPRGITIGGRGSGSLARARYGATLEGVNARLGAARETMARLMGAEGPMADVVGPRIAQLEREIQALHQQAEAIKRVEEAERRLASQRRELIASGQGFYQIGTGAGAVLVSGQDISDANSIRRAPSLRSPRERMALESTLNPVFAGGMAGPGVFVSPESERINLFATATGLGSAFDADKQKRANQVAALQQEYSATERIVALRAGPGGEYQAARRVADLRIEAIEKELEITGDLAKARLESRKVELDLEVRAEEIKRQGLERYRSAAESGFDALVASGAGGLRSFALSQGMGIGRTIAGNLAAQTFRSVSGKLSLTNDPNSFLGKALAGTPFGPDPLKAATDLNTTATAANTMAVSSLTRTLAMSATGGGGGLVRGGVAALAAGVDLGSGEAGAEGYGWYSGGAEGADAGSGEGGAVGAAGRGRFSAMRALGIAGAAIGGGLGAYSGFRSGGARGVMTGIGSLAGASGAIIGLSGVAGPAAPILAGVGLALGVMTSLLGDPKQNRANSISETLKYNQFVSPVSINANMGFGGGYSDYDKYGNVRGSGLSPFPSVEQPYFLYREGVTVPGRTLGQFGGGITVNVNALDAKSIIDRHEDIANAVKRAVQSGGNDLVPTLRQQLG